MHPHAPQPVKACLRLLLPAVAVLALLALLLAGLAGGAVWLLRSEHGTQWLLTRLPGVQAEGVRGALLSDHFEADRLRLQWAGGTQSVTLMGLKGDGLRWAWRPAGGAWVGLDAQSLSAHDVAVDLGPPSGKPLALPASLVLPLRLTVGTLQIDELRVAGLAPVRRLSARVDLGGDGGHRIEQLQLEWDRLRLQGAASVAATAPFALRAQVQLAPLQDSDAYAASLQAAGSLEHLSLDATLRGTARAGHPAPKADVHAVLSPFAAWPLGELSAQTEALDLAALLSSAPETRLSGHVQVQSQSLKAPISAAIELDNALPGRWNEGRLPVRRLVLALQASADQRDRVRLDALDLTLGSSAQGAGGRWRGHGEWVGHQLKLDTTLADVLPQQLDSRAAAMTLSGPLAFTLQGLPSPDPAAKDTVPPWSVELNTTLDGRGANLPQAVQLAIEATADAEHLELRRLRAQSGSALAQANATARRGAGGAWQLVTSGSLNNFDPQPWWPGDANPAWRAGPHRLSAGWQFDIRLPSANRKLAPLALLQSVAGSGALNVHDSMLAGVPLALELTLGQAPSKDGTPSNLRAELHLGGNTVALVGRGDPAGAGTADQWQLDLDAPSLAAMSPLLKLDPTLAAWAPSSGSAHASITAQGRWPQLRTQGQAQLKALEAGELGVASGNATWKVDMHDGDERPLALHAELTGLRRGTQRAQQLRADLSGTLREHKLLVSGALPLAPPPMAEQLLGVSAQAGTRALLQAEGEWLENAAGGGLWRGHVSRLAVGTWDGNALPATDKEAQAQWLDARDLRGEVQFGPGGQLQRIRAAAGQLKLANAAALRWDEVAIDTTGSAPNIQLKAEIEPFAVAPLLARWQPNMGWSGDLRLTARLDVRAAERFDADVVLERRDGDLHVTDERGTQLLGLTDLRFALSAHDGTWTLTQALAGRTLGEAAGAVTIKTTADRRWPTPDAPLDGVLDAHVANLGVWGTWVPAGWRLVGELRTSATIGGRFGAPEYTGSVVGNSLGLRNLLQGVNVSDGNLAIKLQGTGAQIEHFTLKGGDGTIAITGDAAFGSAPSAKLHLVANQFRLLGRIDRQLIASGSADLALQAEQIKLDGHFKIDEGLFDASRSDAPALDDDVTVHHASDPKKAAETAAPPRPRRDVAVAVEVDLGDKLRVRGRGLDTALRGQLRISTPGGRLAVQGTVNTEGGTYQAYGQKLDIDRGIIAFSGAADNPRLDILALRPNTDTRVGVQITGNVLTPRVRLWSDPDSLSDTDKLSWLVLGRATDGLGRTDTALLQRAAVALLSGEGEAPTDALLHNLGIDDLSLRQSDTDVHETVISLGKQLSRRWYVGYERGVNATTGTWQLIYRIAQRFTLRAQSGLENALDVIWVWKFDELPLPLMPKSLVKPAPPPPP
jgi:translocation and assembly module TamB